MSDPRHKEGLAEALARKRGEPADATSARRTAEEVVHELLPHLSGLEIDPLKLVEEIGGPSELAKLARVLLGVASEETRGRPADREVNWRQFVSIELMRRSLGDLGSALDRLAKRADADAQERERERLRKAYRRAPWTADDVTGIASLFASPPPDTRSSDIRRRTKSHR